MPVPAATMTLRSERRVDKIIHGVDQLDEDILTEGPIAIAELTEMLKDKVGEEFEKSIMHPEESTGASMKTLHSEAHGLTGVIEARGGFAYKEFGTSDHRVDPKPGGVLHWNEGGVDYFSKGHEVKGLEADDFVGRAMDELDVEAVLASLFSKSFVSVFEEDV